MKMRKAVAATIALAVICTGCAGGSQIRTVLVDYKHDEFAGSFLSYFPKSIETHPGDTVVFRQAWSGEPHSVTMGSMVDKYGQLLKPYLEIFAKKGYEGLPDETPKNIEPIEKKLPWMSDDNGNIAQNGAQPCFLTKGTPPRDPDEPCRKAQQRQPAFTGRQTYYNSGFIPYEGQQGDTYTVKLAPDVKLGEHFFYCNYHGPFMSGFINVKPKGAEIDSAGDVAKEARREIDISAKPLLREFRAAEAGRTPIPKDMVDDAERLGLPTKTSGGKTFYTGWLAGDGAEEVDNGLIDEFIPSKLEARVGEKLTWVVIGTHTISFDVPKYFPIIKIAKDGKISLNEKIRPPFGGAPKISGLGEHEGASPTPETDGGSWDGEGFWSSGLIESENFAVYHLRITKPGAYKFACLIHPSMVGTLEVS
jgi:plastocyanin